ncbi:hypothetical protein [Bradyrhizobium sp. NBAIM08]|uniref:hypothetical protein n=1 Tax=Bradyrhizobium sp. NBAIM08 TaxID=2793815 RepID=UPI001CD26602|nr:hypothetical protein [Bradyrhizobium sp. NBAIM08]MCA1474144.1 hypothetical protein [Bradyrhizobium sp. NBAIM08]
MAIGYSFGDAHINDAVTEALKEGLKLFILAPYALDVLKNDPRIAAAAKSQLIGFTSRPLSKPFGGDRVAHAELMKFSTYQRAAD